MIGDYAFLSLEILALIEVDRAAKPANSSEPRCLHPGKKGTSALYTTRMLLCTH
jgi:hypothetical protein